MNDFCIGIHMRESGQFVLNGIGATGSEIKPGGSIPRVSHIYRRLSISGYLLSLALLQGCFADQTSFEASKLEDKAKAQFSPAPGVKAAKFIFSDASSGSFTPPSPGGNQSHAALRVFNSDGSLLSNAGPTGSGWPLWISKVELGISGSNNPSAQNADCARFSTATESATKCDFSSSGLPQNFTQSCGGPSNVFRVSEYDCVSGGGTLDGNGSANDGVYVRVVLNRAQLAAFENISMTIEYSASSLNPAPTDPTQCFSASGLFNPANPNCADFAWQVYLKQTSQSLVQPFLLLFPPFSSSVNPSAATSGTSVQSKQLIFPISADGNITEIQLSRIKGMPVNTKYTNTCDDPSTPGANSPHCVGLVLRSLTLFRI